VKRLLGVSAAATLLLAGVCAAQDATTKKPGKAKSACNAINEETACKANDACRWIAAIMDEKTGKEKRKAYCRTQGQSTKKSTAPAK